MEGFKVNLYYICFVAELAAVIVVFSILYGVNVFFQYSFKTKVDLNHR